jgi:hypothetical protein
VFFVRKKDLPNYQILMRSNQLAGLGSVNIPRSTTPGANPYTSGVRKCWNIKSILNNFKSTSGDFTRLKTPVDLRLLGTGIFLYSTKLSANRAKQKILVSIQSPKDN